MKLEKILIFIGIITTIIATHELIHLRDIKQYSESYKFNNICFLGYQEGHIGWVDTDVINYTGKSTEFFPNVMMFISALIIGLILVIQGKNEVN